MLSASITTSPAPTFASDVGHPVIVWDNYPVNYQQRHAPRVFLGPVQNCSASLPSVIAGYLTNPMQQGDAPRVALIKVAGYLTQLGSYDPAAAWSGAGLPAPPPEPLIELPDRRSDAVAASVHHQCLLGDPIGSASAPLSAASRL
ncbi:MAG: beta-N-acetylglucosaminidase domain-containing protein [Clostridia bacterium]